jgi:hypothetical protein
MNLPDFTRVRSGSAECPSDLALDRLQAAELSGQPEADLRAHITGCSLCVARLHERGQGFAAFSELNVSRIVNALAAAEPEAKQSLWQRLSSLLSPAAMGAMALAAVVLLVVSRQSEDALSPGMRAKGGLTLRVHRLSGDHSESMISGDRFKPGDRVRFEVDTPSSGYISIMGVESDGDLYRAWPIREDNGGVQRLDTSHARVLDGAVSLDDAPGREVLYLVHCADPSGPTSCVSRGANAAPSCKPGCSLSPFVLDKTP